MAFAKYLVSATLAFSALLANTHAAPQPGLLDDIGSLVQNVLPILSEPLPSSVTNNPSPECVNVNKGARLCCQSTFNGDIPLVVELASIVGYQLDPNSINGIYCQNDTQCTEGTDLCCQVDSFTQVIPSLLSIALYCQDTPKTST